jgi:tRNA (guanine37-N1)-methyltransferase
LAATEGAILLCGRYEGVDERLIDRCVDEEISLGDFVLSGGEIAAMALIDACVRQLPGALNDSASAAEESFVAGLLDCPHYTRPEVYEGIAVPAVLLSGHHENIRRWRLNQAMARTRERRPELFAKWLAQQAQGGRLGAEEAQLLREIETAELCGRDEKAV